MIDFQKVKEFIKELESNGYTHYVDHYISGASDYWAKSIKGENGDAKYQIIFRKYDMQPDLLDFEPTINLLYYDENVNQDNMIKITLVAPKHTINEVEDIAKTMYDAYKPFVVKNE